VNVALTFVPDAFVMLVGLLGNAPTRTLPTVRVTPAAMQPLL
jgi:hypothetical protein